MFPTLFTYQGVGFHSWGLMVLIAFFSACILANHRAARVGIDPDKLVNLYLLITIGGMMGARLLHFVMADTKVFFANPMVYFDMEKGGFAFLGGLIAALLIGGIYSKLSGINVWKMADVASSVLMLGLAVGRLGCFLAGCCHGAVCAVANTGVVASFKGGSIVTVAGAPFVALEFKRGVGVGAIFDTPLYPTQLWELSVGLLLFTVLSIVWNKYRRFDGQVTALMLVLYAGARSLIEEYRGDAVRGVHSVGLFEMSTSQIVAVSMVAAAVVLVVIKGRGGLQPEKAIEFGED